MRGFSWGIKAIHGTVAWIAMQLGMNAVEPKERYTWLLTREGVILVIVKAAVYPGFNDTVEVIVEDVEFGQIKEIHKEKHTMDGRSVRDALNDILTTLVTTKLDLSKGTGDWLERAVQQGCQTQVVRE